MSQLIAPEARPKLGRTKAARQMLLTMCTSPTPAHVHALEPDDTGALRYVSRQEAIDRKLSVYTGRVSQLDKPFQVRGAPAGFGEWAAIRFTVSGTTPGQARLQKIVNKEKQ